MNVGTRVEKPKGYPFPGVVVAAFDTLEGKRRLVVESDLAPGMLHIFAPEQLTVRQCEWCGEAQATGTAVTATSTGERDVDCCHDCGVEYGDDYGAY